MSYRNEIGKAYLMTYYKVIHNQFSAIFNHAIWYYELSSNPVSKAGNMGKEKTEDMLFLIKDDTMLLTLSVITSELQRFIREFMEVLVEEAEMPDIQQDDAL